MSYQITTSNTIDSKSTLINDLDYIELGKLDSNQTKADFNLSEIKDFVGSILENIKYRQDVIYQTAISNLIKKNNLLELNQRFITGVITEEKFDSILEENPSKFTITIKDHITQYELFSVGNIVKEMKEDLIEYSYNDVLELFSLPSQSITLNLE